MNRVPHLLELRFAPSEPDLDTTSVNTATTALVAKPFSIVRIGSDGFMVFHKAKIEKAVHDRRASLDEDEIRQAMLTLVKEESKRTARIPVEPFPADSRTVLGSPRLTSVPLDPSLKWNGGDEIRTRIAEWTKHRGKSSRLYPGALV